MIMATASISIAIFLSELHDSVNRRFNTDISRERMMIFTPNRFLEHYFCPRRSFHAYINITTNKLATTKKKLLGSPHSILDWALACSGWSASRVSTSLERIKAWAVKKEVWHEALSTKYIQSSTRQTKMIPTCVTPLVKIKPFAIFQTNLNLPKAYFFRKQPLFFILEVTLKKPIYGGTGPRFYMKHIFCCSSGFIRDKQQETRRQKASQPNYAEAYFPRVPQAVELGVRITRSTSALIPSNRCLDQPSSPRLRCCVCLFVLLPPIYKQAKARKAKKKL